MSQRSARPTLGLSFNPVAISYAYPVAIARNNDLGVFGALSRFNQPAKTVMLMEFSYNSGTNYYGADVTLPDEGFIPGPGTGFTSSSPSAFGYLISGYRLGGAPSTGGSPATGVMPSAGTTCTDTACEPRHFDGANFLLADGHVKWYKPENVSPGGAALGSQNAQTTTGTIRAEGTENGTRQITFSPI